MSSLLDILHRKDSRAERESLATESAPEHAAQPTELRLAIDNGPPEAPTASRALDTTATELSIAPEAPATAASNPLPAAPTASDPFATGRITAVQLQRRSRRSTVWLGGGLALILVSAGVATWLLNEVRVDTGGDGSLFTAPGSNSSAASLPALNPVKRPLSVSGPVEAATASRGAAPVGDTSAVPQQPASSPAIATTATDTTWFDAPAAEELAEAPGDLATVPKAEPIRIVRGTTTNPLFPKLRDAWIAFQAADYPRAEALYREVRAADADNVDALLGLAALTARGQRTEEARDLYQAVLLAEPKNATAISALSTLPATGARNLDESTLKSLLREQPGAANLHFALGLQYVAQGRWPDAQNAFFEAVRNEPTNADYAYNLAVSLDRLGQAGPAAAYYQRALDLATASALFDSDVARQRLATLRAVAP